MRDKRPQLLLLALVSVLSMSLWFSTAAVVPLLTALWGLTPGLQSWLTMSVQLGFVAGAVGSAVLNLPDRFPAPRIVAIGAMAGAVFNLLIPLSGWGVEAAIPLRAMTGAALALVYPPSMKIVATWCREDRGLFIGVLVGALTLGSAMPHLMAAVPALSADWRLLMLGTSAQSAVAGLVAWGVLEMGPYRTRGARFEPARVLDGLRVPSIRLANLGYFGHMWELYAMWTWFPVALTVSFASVGWTESAARAASFAVVASGAVSCVVAGRWADRWGRTRVTSTAMALSGACALTAGWLMAWPLALLCVGVVWGLTVIADSAQFSAAVSELADSAYVGTALTVQTAIGFLLTMISIRIVPAVSATWGWPLAFSLLAAGPAAGVVSMLLLRRHPDAGRMASGRR